MARLPSLFVSHGAPTLATEPSAAAEFLSTYGADLDRPTAILAVSSHWETMHPVVGAATAPRTIHDFRGFPPDVQRFVYPAAGSTDLAQRTADALKQANFPVLIDDSRGMDHGTWVPLARLFPDASIPVATLSVQSHQGPDYHLALGRALRPLRDEGVLIVTSGCMTHNLYEFYGQPVDAPAEPYVAEFADWVAEAVARQDCDALRDYRAQAPHAVRAHPTDEHLLPLFVAMGAGTHSGQRVHHSIAHGVLAMDVYAFN